MAATASAEMKRGTLVLALTGVSLAQPALAQEEAEAPDLDFLEYLGSWQAEDDEWFEIAEWEKDNPEKDRDEGRGKKVKEPPEPEKEER
jgi:hypothetical protein